MLYPHRSTKVKRTCSLGRWKIPLSVQGEGGHVNGTAQRDDSQGQDIQTAKAALMFIHTKREIKSVNVGNVNSIFFIILILIKVKKEINVLPDNMSGRFFLLCSPNKQTPLKLHELGSL